MSTSLANIESLPPEIVTSIFLKLPLREVLRACRTSRYLSSFCQSWDFWRERAWLDLQIPSEVFNANREQDPRDRYRLLANFNKNPEYTIYQVARLGDVSLIQYLLPKTRQYSVGRLLLDAIRHLPMVSYLVEHVLSSLPTHAREQLLNDTLMAAAENGQLPVVAYLVSLGPTNLNSVLERAASMSRWPIVHFLVDHGANQLDQALLYAARANNLPMVQYLIDHGVNNLNAAFTDAVRFGALSVVEYFVNQGATNLNDALEEAARFGHLPVVQFLATHGAADLRWPIRLLSSLYAVNPRQREKWNQISDYLRAEIKRQRRPTPMVE